MASRHTVKDPSKLTPRKPECGFYGCNELHTDDSLMCPEHKEVMAGIRKEFAKSKTIYRTRSDQRKGGPRGSTCCRQNCLNAREHPSPYCNDCEEDFSVIGD